nr:protein bunched, class 2/F/G isoform-like isoform X2 [Nothobranchius furzeri]XP_054596699.1 protein bunched, class 2/F/G isoform-like isoform X2 [Nothobranchius furzeri]XP_054596701.1 protein bunched, class 2/F/G isoform-like isoform X2 [Nothobranchius furzeri]XP_054596702.1 protein bunched, class 2/F/G isoform-like isoform X2 [Nothobranchius furzeri]
MTLTCCVCFGVDFCVLQSPSEYEELSDDELPSRNWSKAQRQIKPLIAENKRLKEDNFKHPIEAMKELPAVGQNLRDISELLSLISSSASARSTLVQTPVRTPARSELQLSAPASPQVDSADLVSLVSGESKSPDRSSTLCGLQVTQFTSETWQCSSTAGKRCPVTPPPHHHHHHHHHHHYHTSHWSGRGDSRLNREAKTFLSPATWASSFGGIPKAFPSQPKSLSFGYITHCTQHLWLLSQVGLECRA